MKTVNSISGGKTSAYIAMNYPADYNVFSVVCTDDSDSRIKDHQMNNFINDKLQKFIPQYGEFIATAEDDKTLYAMRDLEQLLGSEIIWLRGKSFDDVITSANTHGGCPSRLPSKHFRYCTEEMKMVPIFKWWLTTLGVRVKMRIGFRSDEYMRMESFMNSNPNHFKFPDYCKNYGNKQQHHENYNWRYCSFDLIKDQVNNKMIKEFWKNYNIDFPVISNCIGCFWKNVSTLAVQAHINPTKMDWFASKEQLNKGTWQQSNVDYQGIIDNKKQLAKEQLFEVVKLGESCDSGGCHG